MSWIHTPGYLLSSNSIIFGIDEKSWILGKSSLSYLYFITVTETLCKLFVYF